MTNNQLTLFGAFDADKKRREAFFSELETLKRDYKYLRANINAYNASYDVTDKSPILRATNSARSTIDYAGYYLAHLMYGVSRDIETEKGKGISDYVEDIKFEPASMPSETPKLPGIYKTMSQLQSRLKRLISPYKKELKQHKHTQHSYEFLVSSMESAVDTLNLVMNEAA